MRWLINSIYSTQGFLLTLWHFLYITYNCWMLSEWNIDYSSFYMLGHSRIFNHWITDLQTLAIKFPVCRQIQFSNWLSTYGFQQVCVRWFAFLILWWLCIYSKLSKKFLPFLLANASHSTLRNLSLTKKLLNATFVTLQQTSKKILKLRSLIIF